MEKIGGASGRGTHRVDGGQGSLGGSREISFPSKGKVIYAGEGEKTPTEKGGTTLTGGAKYPEERTRKIRSVVGRNSLFKKVMVIESKGTPPNRRTKLLFLMKTPKGGDRKAVWTG